MALGLVTGFFSGLFGVGGGVILVPSFIALFGLDPRRAAGTSLLALLPMAVTGVIAYAAQGSVDVRLAGLLAAGGLLGAPAGTWLLHRISLTSMRIVFLCFLAVTIVSLFLVLPSREAVPHIDVVSGGGLVALGFLTGVCSGLLGIGGGAIVVPVLIVAFGTSDLLAKGSSLLMMIVTSISGTVSNLLRRNFDAGAAAIAGCSACLTTSAGAWAATVLPPFAANAAFAFFLGFVAARTLRDLLASRGDGAKGRDAGA